MAKPDWKPIVSAPTDGTWVRVRGFNYGDPIKGRHHATAFYQDSSWIEVGSGGSLLFYLTDWAPTDGVSVPVNGAHMTGHTNALDAISEPATCAADTSPAQRVATPHAAPTRQDFERIIDALNYDGSDTDSLTVGEIRRSLAFSEANHDV